MSPENRPERITLFDSARSIIDLGKLAVATVLSKIDTKLANAINTEEDES